jgi:hypothetical protein
MRQMAQQAREAQQLEQVRDIQIKEKQRGMRDDEIVRGVLQQHADAMEKGDFDTPIGELYRQGQASAAKLLQDKVFEWRKGQAEEMKTRVAAYGDTMKLAMNLADGVTDEESFQRMLPTATAMLPKEVMSMVGTTYDPARMTQLRHMGQSGTEYLTEQQNIFDRAAKQLEMDRQIRKDDKEWQNQLPLIQERLTNLVSRQLSLSKSAEDYAGGLKLAQSFLSPYGKQVTADVLGQFDPQFGPGSVEKARLLGMTQNERSEEKAKAATLAEQRAARADEDEVQLSDEALTMKAIQVAMGGSIGQPGRGKMAQENWTKINNKVAELFPGVDLSTQELKRKGLGQAITMQEKALSNVESYRELALGNMTEFLKSMKGVVDVGSPLANKPLRSLDYNLLGSKEQAAMKTAYNAVYPEIARMLTASPQSFAGIVSVEALEEARKTLPAEGGTYKQVFAAAQIIERDMNRRVDAIQNAKNALYKAAKSLPEQLGADVAGRAGGAGATGLPADYKAEPMPQNPKNGTEWKSPRGVMVFDGKGWNPK